MKYLIMLAALGLAGCAMEVDSNPPEQEQTVEEEAPLPGPPYDREDTWNPCPGTYETLHAPDGTTYTIYLPGLCNLNYHDKGDPPPDEQLNPKINPPEEVNPEQPY